jgi:hypothetical protein
MVVVLTIAVVSLLYAGQTSAKSSRIRNRQVYEVDGESDSSYLKQEGIFHALEQQHRDLELKESKAEKTAKKDGSRHSKDGKAEKKEEMVDEDVYRQAPDETFSFSMDFCMSMEMEFCMSM